MSSQAKRLGMLVSGSNNLRKPFAVDNKLCGVRKYNSTQEFFPADAFT